MSQKLISKLHTINKLILKRTLILEGKDHMLSFLTEDLVVHDIDQSYKMIHEKAPVTPPTVKTPVTSPTVKVNFFRRIIKYIKSSSLFSKTK